MVAFVYSGAYCPGVAGRMEWVLLADRMPREPSNPRIAAGPKPPWPGVAQIVGGAGGEATLCLGRFGTVRQEHEFATRMAEAITGGYRAIIDAARAGHDETDAGPRRVLARLGRELRRVGKRDYFPPPSGRRLAPRWTHSRRWTPDALDDSAGCHVDRAACVWLVRRFFDTDATFCFVDDPDEIPGDATPFDMPEVELSHHGGDCGFETMLRHFDLDDTVLWDLARIVHEADLADDRLDAPDGPRLDAVGRGLSVVVGDNELLAVMGPLLDGLYQYLHRALLLGRDPA